MSAMAYCGVMAGEVKVREAPAVRQQMQLQPGRRIAAVLEQIDEGISMQRWLTAGEAQTVSGRREQAHDSLGSIKKPGVLAVPGRLGAHKAVVVALLSE